MYLPIGIPTTGPAICARWVYWRRKAATPWHTSFLLTSLPVRRRLCTTPSKNLIDAEHSFTNLASKSFPSGYSKSVCVSACTQKTPNIWCWFLKRRLTNSPRRHGLANGQASSLSHPRQVSARLAPPLWCYAFPLLLPVRARHTLTAVCALPK